MTTIVEFKAQANIFENTLFQLRAIGVDLSKAGEKYKEYSLFQKIFHQ